MYYRGGHNNKYQRAAHDDDDLLVVEGFRYVRSGVAIRVLSLVIWEGDFNFSFYTLMNLGILNTQGKTPDNVQAYITL